MGQRMISPGQVKMIHALASRLAIDENAYRAALKSRFGVTTSKTMTMDQAGELIDEWELEAIRQRLWTINVKHERYVDLFIANKKDTPTTKTHGIRNGNMASWKQLGKINNLWLSLTKMDDYQKRDKALNAFVLRIAKVSDVRFLDMDGARGVIAALTKMQRHYQYDGEESRAAV